MDCYNVHQSEGQTLKRSPFQVPRGRVALDVPFGNKKQPEQPTFPRGIFDQVFQVIALFLHAEDLSQRSGFAKMEPSSVVFAQPKIGAEQEERRHDTGDRWGFDVVVGLPNSERLIQQHHPACGVMGRASGSIGTWTDLDLDPRLYQHESGPCGQKTVRFHGAVHVCDPPSQVFGLQNRHGGEQLGKEKLGAAIDRLQREEARCAVEGGRHRRTSKAIETNPCQMCQIGLLLGFSQLGYNLCAAAFRPFLLWDGIVGARQPGLATIGAWVGAITPNLTTLPSVANRTTIWNGRTLRRWQASHARLVEWVIVSKDD